MDSGLQTKRSYDSADRLLSVSNVCGTNVISSCSYSLDATGRRIQRSDADNSRLDYGYDLYDQLISAAKTNSPNPAADARFMHSTR